MLNSFLIDSESRVIDLLEIQLHVAVDFLPGAGIVELEGELVDLHALKQLQVGQLVGGVDHLRASVGQIEVGGSHVEVGTVVNLGCVLKITHLDSAIAHFLSIHCHCSKSCENHVKFLHTV